MRQFRPLYRRALQESYKDGRLTEKDYTILMDAYKHPRRRNADGAQIDLMLKIEECTKEHTKTSDWPSIWKWLKENWLTILKLILSLLPMFLMIDN
jgi:hypothetical protein